MNNLSIQERIDLVHHKLKFIPESQRPNVLFIESLDPLVFEHGETLKHVCQLAGGTLIHTEESESPYNADKIIVFSNNLPMGRNFELFLESFKGDEWQNSVAIKNNQVFFIEEECYSIEENKVEVVEMLAEVLYPGYFVFGYEDQCWLQFEM